MDRKDLFKPYNGDKGYIFVSYYPGDAEVVFDILSDLHRRGCRVWYNAAPMLMGGSSLSELVEKIKNCKVFLCFLSPKYLDSRDCARELNFALSSHKRVIPIKTEDYKLPDTTAFMLSGIHWYNRSRFSSSEEMIDHLVEEDSEVLSPCIHTETIPEAEAPPADGGPSSARPEAFAKGGSRRRQTLWDIGSSVLSAAGAVIAAPIAAPVLAGKFIIDKIGEKKQEKEKKQQEKPAAKDSVNFSVLSPKAVKADSYGVINLHMYTDVQREVVEEAIRASNGLLSETRKDGFEVSRGTSITARLESDQAEIKDSMETRIWNGKSLHFDFQFYVPKDYSQSQIAFTCYIECNGIPITRLNFITAVSRQPDSKALPAKVTKSDYKKAFISYSRKDEQRMLERVVGIQELAPEMKFWLDKQSLDAGDFWREEIKKAITISDVLLLFWSVPASQSKEVENEWTYALEKKGLSFIAPVPLDPPKICPPPAQLKELNFTVRAFCQNELTKKLSYYDSDNILIIT